MKKKFMLLLSFIICATMLLGIAASNTVVISATVPIKSTINMTTSKKATVTKGYRYRMKAVINGKIVKANGKWKSNNKKIATVTNTGVVKAVKAGTTTITVKYRGKTLKTIVIVTNACKHSWKINKKATCQTTGKKTCQVCGKTANIAIKDHAWVTETWKKTVGLGEGKDVCVELCTVCYKDLTHMTKGEMTLHCLDCGSGRTQYLGTDYKGYKIVEISETYCKTCGDSAGKRTEKVIKKDTDATLHDHYTGNQELMFITN